MVRLLNLHPVIAELLEGTAIDHDRLSKGRHHRFLQWAVDSWRDGAK